MTTLVSPDQRVVLSAQPAGGVVQPQLEAVFVGSQAAAPDFAAASSAVAAAAQMGFPPAPGDTSLNDLPLAFTDIGSFRAAFPGDDGWLARAVNDYFAAGGLRAWVVRVAVDPASPLDAYLTPNPPIVASVPPGGIAIAMQVPSAGLLVLPDLEQNCLAAAEPPPVPPVPPALPPAFRPLADAELPPPAAPPAAGIKPVAPYDAISRIAAGLAARPDMLCLFALPVGADPTQSMPALANRTIAYVRGAPPPGGMDQTQIQAFAPLVLDAAGNVATPSGLIAGMLCANAQANGVWRSIAGSPLPLGVTPLRRIENSALAQLRQSGIAVLVTTKGATVLDDDILACMQGPAGSAARRAAGTRRLVGWLVRNLRVYGEQLVFESVLDDGRVELVLNSLFADLFKRGALTGGQVSDAVQIKRLSLGKPNAVGFQIWVSTALAVESIRLQFLEGTLQTSLGTLALAA